jgi:uncharacterized protein (DUF952 family)
MATIYHLAESEFWSAAQRSGSYERSTLGRSLAEEGFIHCSSAKQWPVVRRAFYAGYPGNLVLLEIDPSRLTAPLVREVGDPLTGEEFPHVYGPLNLDAVVGARELAAPHA